MSPSSLNPMSIQYCISSKPESVQIVIKARIVKLAIHMPYEEMLNARERLAEEALKWWEEEIYSSMTGLTEEQAAEFLVERMRGQEVWGKILREGTN